MTFEEWADKQSEFKTKPPVMGLALKEIAHKAWNAAKEDSKPVARIYWKECFHGGIDMSYWSFHECRWHFDSKEAAQQWAIENGYRPEQT